MGMRLVGFYDDKKVKGSQPVGDLEARIEGTLEALVQHVHDHKVDQVYIALPLGAGGRIKELVDQLSDTTASVFLIPDLFTFNLLHASWMDLDGIPAISIVENPHDGMEGWVKRLEDVMISSFILLLVAIPMLVIAVAVKLSSPGPVIFRQRRYGLDGREIDVWKFRSMTSCEEGGEVPQAKRCDPRVTRLGAFLRRTSLDELPQFINVLQGQMSIVGPRPHAVAHNEQYRKIIHGYMLRHKVKPGITGHAQVSGWRGETNTSEKMKRRVEHDIEYIQNWSVWLDLKIIVLTIFKGFTGENAY
jgi:putative colanic acid biosynthesis UDP-glucose lipid carrier transferase